VHLGAHASREVWLDELRDWTMLLDMLATEPNAALALGVLRRDARRDASAGRWLLPDKRSRYEDLPSRWLAVDLDHVSGEPEDAGETLPDYIAETMPELSGCAYVAAFTSSAGIKGARVRLVFELEEPRTLAAMRSFAIGVNTRAGHEVIDASVYTPGHLVLTAAPRLFAHVAQGNAVRLQSLPRPVPTKAWFAGGDLASIPDALVTTVTAAYVPTAQRGESLGKAAAAELLQALGPGSYNVGIHRWLCHAAFVAADHRADAAFDAAVSAIQDRIRETSDAEGLERRLRVHGNPRVLRRKWNAARERRAAMLRPAIGVASPQAATAAPVPAIAINTAGAADLATLPAAACTAQAVPPLTIDAVRSQLQADVCAEADKIVRGAERHVLLTHAPGTGKTTALLAALHAGRLCSDLTRIRVPTHALAEELVAKLKAHARGLAPNGIYFDTDLVASIRHHKGRSQPGMCTDAQAKPKAELAESLGVSVKKHVCANCDTGKAGKCAWLAQDDDEDSGVIVEAHHVANGPSKRRADLVINDEGTIGATIQSGSDTLHIAELGKAATIYAVREGNMLGAPLGRATVELSTYRNELVSALKASVPRKEGEAGKLLTQGIPSLVAEATFEARKGKRREKRTGTGAAHAAELETQLQATLYARIANDKTPGDKRAEAVALLRASQSATRLYRAIDASARRSYVFGVAVYFQGRGKARLVRAKCVTRNAEPAAVASISFDGTADVDVWRALVSPAGAAFDGEVYTAAPEIPAGALTVFRYGDKAGARAAIVPDNAPSAGELAAVEKRDWLINLPAWVKTTGAIENVEDQLLIADVAVAEHKLKRTKRKKRADSYLDTLWRFVLFEAMRRTPRAVPVAGQHVSVLLIAQKAAVDHLRALGLPDTVATAHFGALRGLDAFRDVPCCIVIGRPRPSDIDLELTAEALHSHNAAVTEIHRQPAGSWSEQHPDALVGAVQRVTAAAEVKQAVARIRPYDRSTGRECVVHVFGFYDTGLPPELVQLRTWADAERSPVEVALACGAVFSDPRLNWQAYPKLFAKGGRVGDDQRREFAGLLANLARGLKRQHASAVAGVVARNFPSIPIKKVREGGFMDSLLRVEGEFSDALAFAADGSDSDPTRKHKLVKLRVGSTRGPAVTAIVDAGWSKADVERRLGCQVTAWRDVGAASSRPLQITASQ